MTRVLFIQYTNPAAYPPLDHASAILAESGCAVRMVGVQVQGVEALSLSEVPGRRVQLLRESRPGFGQKLQYLRFALRVLRLAIVWRPRWVYASDFLSAPIGLLLSLLPGVRVIYHEHDAPSDASRSPLVRLCLRARRALVRRATVVVAPSDSRGAHLRMATDVDRPVLTVWNCPRRAEAEAPLKPCGETLRLLYHGTIVPERLPAQVIRAMASVPGTELTIVGYETTGARGYVAELLATARSLGLEHRVAMRGAMSRGEGLLQIAAACDVGLVFVPTSSGDINMRQLLGASNKMFEYLATGLALLVSDVPDWRTLVHEERIGVACDPGDPDAIAAALRWMVGHRAEVRAMGQRGRRRVLDDWNYEAQFEQLRGRIVGVPRAAAARESAMSFTVTGGA